MKRDGLLNLKLAGFSQRIFAIHPDEVLVKLAAVFLLLLSWVLTVPCAQAQSNVVNLSDFRKDKPAKPPTKAASGRNCSVYLTAVKPSTPYFERFAQGLYARELREGTSLDHWKVLRVLVEFLQFHTGKAYSNDELDIQGTWEANFRTILHSWDPQSQDDQDLQDLLTTLVNYGRLPSPGRGLAKSVANVLLRFHSREEFDPARIEALQASFDHILSFENPLRKVQRPRSKASAAR